jgi:hypothetical protein
MQQGSRHDHYPRNESPITVADDPARIPHDWDLPTKKMLVGKAYDALPPKGGFVVFETLIDDERRTNALEDLWNRRVSPLTR